MTGAAIVLGFRLGWPAIIGISVPLLIFPLQTYIGKKNGELLQKVNINKDQRVKVCTEIIEGIKFVKLYGWELAFKRMIQNLR
jgi:ABC-type multidrug transport system fused ATPase/permease subunit